MIIKQAQHEQGSTQTILSSIEGVSTTYCVQEGISVCMFFSAIAWNRLKKIQNSAGDMRYKNGLYTPQLN